MTEEIIRIRRKRKRKKKKKLKALWITLGAIVILAGAGWGGFHYLTHKDVQAADIGLDSDFFDFSSFDQKVEDSSSSSPMEGSVSKSKDEPATSQVQEPPSTNKGDSNNKEDTISKTDLRSTAQLDTEQQIEQKYSAVFQSLQSVALSKIDQLAESAIHDYKQGKSITSLSSTYMSAANKLEDKVNAAFYKQLDHMKSELKAKGLSDKLAKQAETTYKEAIAAKKSEMMDKVVKFK